MTVFAPPVVAWRGTQDGERPLVVLLHGRGSDEVDIVTLANHLPQHLDYAALRAPIAEGGGYAWFANRGIGRPVAESLAETMAWFRTWLDDITPASRPVVLVGFSGGAAFAGGVVLDDPSRYAGAAILYGTLPFEAGVPTTPERLAGLPVLVVHGAADVVIPASCSSAPGPTCPTKPAAPPPACETPAATASASPRSTSCTAGSLRSPNHKGASSEHSPPLRDRAVHFRRDHR